MITYPVLAFGHDFGNASECGVLVGGIGKVECQIPSIASIGSWQKVVSAAHGSGQSVNDILAPDHYVLEYNSNGTRIEKYIGNKVYADGATPLTSHGDSSRYWLNNYSLEMLMVSTASVIRDHEYGVHVVTGLPIKIYLDDANNIALVKNALQGTHVFMLNGIQRVMHVESVNVIMEGAGALIEHGSKMDVLQGVIDLGGRTTDLYVSRGQKPRAANSVGFDMGVASAAERFSEKFREAYHYAPSFETVQALLRQHVAGEMYRTVRDKGHERVPDERLAALLNSSLREIGKEIATKIAAAWDNTLNEFDIILIVGGGAYYFAEDIQARIPGARVAPKPAMANAFGYARLADAIATRSRAMRSA